MIIRTISWQCFVFMVISSTMITLGANSLNAIKILANPLIAIDPTCHRHKKIPSMPFSGIEGIGENFNGIQGINYRTLVKHQD